MYSPYNKVTLNPSNSKRLNFLSESLRNPTTMQEMSVAATTGEGGQMTVNVNGQQMNVTVPAGVKEGQNFTFQVPQAAQAVGTPVVAQAAPVVAQANYTPTGIPGVQLNNSLAPNMVQYTNPADNKDYMPTGQVATDKCC